MSATLHDPTDLRTWPASIDGFEVLDACHQRILFTLEMLEVLLVRLEVHGSNDAARAMASEIVEVLSTVAPQHHEDEERHLFPSLLANGDERLVQNVLRLQQDHHWMDVDWRELRPLLAAVANGQSGFDLDQLREESQIFIALSRDHIVLEETVIYPEARERMDEAERRTMGRQMATRRKSQGTADAAT